MKNNLFLLAFCAFCAPLFAQIQTGLVREQNSKRRPVGGVQVTFSDAVPTTSDDAGNFRLAFQGKKAGDLIFFSEIKKSGYELVNGKDLEVLKISSTERLVEDIILARAGTVDAAKKEYYGISDKALLAGFEREKKALRDKLQKKELEQQDYLERLAVLQEQYDVQKQNLDALAEKFARVNFDDVTPVYQEALELFKAGKVSEAIARLESIDPARRTEEIIKEEKRIADAQAELDSQKVALAREKRQQIANLRLLADMYGVQFDPAKAESQYDQLLRLDSTDLEILRDAADFYLENHRYDKAKRAYRLVIAHPRAEEWQIANAFSFIGELHTATGSLPDALDAYTKAFEAYEKLHQQNPSKTFYKNNLASSYEKLGSTHTSLGNLDKALTFFEERSRLGKELYAAYPQNVGFKNGLATSYLLLGQFFRDEKKDSKKAKAYIRKGYDLYAELVRDFPNYASFRRNYEWAKKALAGLE